MIVAIAAADLAVAQAEGRRAHDEHRSATPALSPVIRVLAADLPMGQDAADLFRAFRAGYDQAVADACLRLATS